MKKERNSVLNVLNVLSRISNKDFIINCWKNNNYFSVVTSCCEAIELLDGFMFFDIIKTDHGVWGKYVHLFSDQLLLNLISLAKEIDSFKNCELEVDLLLKDTSWIKIMNLSLECKKGLESELELSYTDYEL